MKCDPNILVLWIAAACKAAVTAAVGAALAASRVALAASKAAVCG